MKTSTLALILAGFSGMCYLTLRQYEHTIDLSSWLDLRNPCRPKGLWATTTNALPSDGIVQQKMVGIWWHSADPQHFENKLLWRLSWVTLASNGDYVCHFSNDGVAETNVLQGHWRVKDGLLVDTITKGAHPGQREPVVFTNQLLRVNDRELVYRSYSNERVVMFRKVKQVNR